VFTLNFPVRLPDEHTYFDDPRYAAHVPPLQGGLSLGCISNEGCPLVLKISGFQTEQDAIDFCPSLIASLRIAALDSKHSLTPSTNRAVTSIAKHFDGSVPTVTPTDANCLPYHTSTRQSEGLHISVLAKLIADSLGQSLHTKAAAKPALALALELFSDFEFTGGPNAQFVMLLTALEVLIPKTSKHGKRGAVLGLIKSGLANAGHTDPKPVRKELDRLYDVRNGLIHEGKTVTAEDLATLRDIVRIVLKSMLS
jgi:hypothetical protein